MFLAAKLFGIFNFKKKENSPYWLKISTKVPKCIYYFGPFENYSEAKKLQAGYIEDLIEEDALGIHIELVQCPEPPDLTICEDEKLF